MPAWIEPFFTAQGLIALLTLTLLEIVLGIDNVVFIAVLCGKLPPEHRLRTGRIGIGLAVLTRILLLFAIQWLLSLSKVAIFTLPAFMNSWSGGGSGHGAAETATVVEGAAAVGRVFSAKDLVILLGGLFLLWKATTEIHGKITGDHLPGDPTSPTTSKSATVGKVIIQIILIDIVFSIDSVITAAGMSKDIPVMVVAVLLSAVVMVVFAGPIMTFVSKHPTIKVLALAFLVLIGTMLVAESFGAHIPKGYIYFAMAFSLAVEIINMKMRAKDGHRAVPPIERKPGDGAEPLV